MKKRTAVAALVSAAVLAGCGAESTEDVGTVTQNLEKICHNPDGYYGMMAALAVAVGHEMGQWEATTYLYNNGWRDIRIAEEAKPICQSRGRDDCGNVQAILDLQRVDYLFDQNGQRVFDGIQFYQQLQVYLERQKIWEGRTGANSCGPRPHQLTLSALEPGVCQLTYDYVFDVEMDTDPAGLECKLKFAGWPENEFLQFRATADTVTIDPIGGMIEGEPSPVGGCRASYLVYDPDQSEAGSPCCPGGATGTLEISSWSDSTLVCTW